MKGQTVLWRNDQSKVLGAPSSAQRWSMPAGLLSLSPSPPKYLLISSILFPALYKWVESSSGGQKRRNIFPGKWNTTSATKNIPKQNFKVGIFLFFFPSSSTRYFCCSIFHLPNSFMYSSKFSLFSSLYFLPSQHFAIFVF